MKSRLVKGKKQPISSMEYEITLKIWSQYKTILSYRTSLFRKQSRTWKEHLLTDLLLKIKDEKNCCFWMEKTLSNLIEIKEIIPHLQERSGKANLSDFKLCLKDSPLLTQKDIHWGEKNILIDWICFDWRSPSSLKKYIKSLTLAEYIS